MIRAFKVKYAIFALLILGAGYVLGYFFGSMQPSPSYIADLQTMPLLMNSPEDVSELVRSHLPDDPYEAFKIVANSSEQIKAYYSKECECDLIVLQRYVTRLPLPDRELTIYFKVKDGKLDFESADVVIWFV
ncbi:hypothetical protein [Labrenzia sp. OB1]|uniref:hypothetical protein n=1 Tax=Labrenzia sp. OB1 TaxID=1561204 RepID=UPI0007B264A8|nr:hypothetical protein [Labrenzia sp. OB1]KZM49030.1 hypothetical protein OA90_17775 [Labrenzia sp. OB1]